MLNYVKWLACLLRKKRIELCLDPYDTVCVDLDIGSLTLHTAERLVDHDLAVGESYSLALCACGKQECAHGSRHTHVVKSLYDNNPLLNFEETESYKRYRQIESQIRQEELDLPLYQLKHSKRGSHLKYVFCSDDRYILTVAKTGSDKRGIDNAISDAGKHFLEPRK